MSLLTPEEQEIAFELFNDGANQVDEELSHIYYHHQCPDYRLIAQPDRKSTRLNSSHSTSSRMPSSA